MSRLGQVRGRARRDPDARRDAQAGAGGHARRCARGGRAGTVPADDARGGRTQEHEGAARGPGVIRVGVLGAAGRMGREVRRAVAAADDLELVAAVDPEHAGVDADGAADRGSPDALRDAGAEVAVDFTHPSAVLRERPVVSRATAIHAVVGTTGLSPADLEELRGLADGGDGQLHRRAELRARRGAPAAVRGGGGAVLRRRRGDRAPPRREGRRAERHRARDGARDRATPGRARGPPPTRSAPTPPPVAPTSGACGCTRCACRASSRTRRSCSAVRGRCSSLRHDALDRTAFMPGVLLAVRSVADRPGLTVGLDALLD